MLRLSQTTSLMKDWTEYPLTSAVLLCTPVEAQVPLKESCCLMIILLGLLRWPRGSSGHLGSTGHKRCRITFVLQLCFFLVLQLLGRKLWSASSPSVMSLPRWLTSTTSSVLLAPPSSLAMMWHIKMTSFGRFCWRWDYYNLILYSSSSYRL